MAKPPEGILRRRPERMATNMRWAGVAGVIVLLTVVLAGQPGVAAAPALAPTAWAVLIEHNSYGGHYLDLPVGYVNSTRMLTLLIARGWPADHILLVRDSLDRRLLPHATDWLAARVRPGDLALLYVAGEYKFYEQELTWNATLPGLWRRVPTSRRVLIVETCFAERLTAAVKGIPGVGLPSVGRNEWNWWGLRETNRLIRGGSFTYFLVRALESQPKDAPLDFSMAFSKAVPDAQEYFRTVIAVTPGALDPFHVRGNFPERLSTFPNPHLVEEADVPASSARASTP
jgi:hypothetical protein